MTKEQIQKLNPGSKFGQFLKNKLLEDHNDRQLRAERRRIEEARKRQDWELVRELQR